jgi:hypothetical protein
LPGAASRRKQHAGLLRKRGAYPAILALGNSRFWYPLPTGYKLLQQLSQRLLKPDYADMLSLGHVDARIEDTVSPRTRGCATRAECAKLAAHN